MNTNVSAEMLSPVTHNQIPVITTELLASLYGTEVNSIQQNFKRNANRFVTGKHFFKLEGCGLRDFKNRLTDSQPVAKHTRSLILWTERGAARHAKMLETDQAWEVFEKLEDCYFNKKAEPAAAGAINLDILLAIRDDKIAFITQHKAGTLLTVDDALSLLRQRGWLVMPREELAGRLMGL